MPEYLKFIEDAFNFMEKYQYESGMKAVVSEISDIKNINEAVQLFNLSFKAYAKKSAYEELQEKQFKAAEVLKKIGFIFPQN